MGLGFIWGPTACLSAGRPVNFGIINSRVSGVWEFGNLNQAWQGLFALGCTFFGGTLAGFFLKYPTMWLARVLGRAVSAWGLHSYSRLVRLDSQLMDFRSLENKVAPTLNPKP